MNTVEFVDITPATLPFIQKLLVERNGTLPGYVEWKYGGDSLQGFRGIVAFIGETPVGCFGLMPKTLCLEEQASPCGWFADWYVSPSARRNGLGGQLLKQITKKGYQYFFGHPGPKIASKICLQNGWRAIPFQSSRRFIISPYAYYKRRTHSIFKHMFLVLKYQLRTKEADWIHKGPRTPISQNTQAYFVDQNLDWLCLQPVNPKVNRSHGDWMGKKVVIHYCDDLLPTSETRRRILWIENIRENPQDVYSFFEEVKKSTVDYVEVFTTDKFLDDVLARAGAVRFAESPIVCYGNAHEVQNVCIQGGDRENWLYLAGGLR